MSSAICFRLDQSEILLSGNGLSLPNDKILDMTKLKVFADNKLKVAGTMISLYDRVENIVGNGENAGNWQFYF